jgi:sugar O-acyltransferase (sialic acid O-acetyltransferase NeuD family)
MTNKLIICGAGNTADVLYHFFSRQSEYEVVAFTVDKKYIHTEKFNGLPLVPFEKVESLYHPEMHSIFVAIGYSRQNKLRSEKLLESKKKGYSIISYIHPNSGVPSDLIYGENCFIMNDVHIHPHVSIGDNVFIWSGTIICHHSSIGNNCWFTSGVNIAGNATIGSNCFFAINSTVTNDVKVGNRCLIGANALVNKDVSDGSVMIEAATKKYALDSDKFLDLKNDKI